jgi:hypothetical protein
VRISKADPKAEATKSTQTRKHAVRCVVIDQSLRRGLCCQVASLLEGAVISPGFHPCSCEANEFLSPEKLASGECRSLD